MGFLGAISKLLGFLEDILKLAFTFLGFLDDTFRLTFKFLESLEPTFRFLGVLIGPACMLVFPLYASVRAIQCSSTVQTPIWLTYWILYSSITLFELLCWNILAWLPFWPYVKLLFCAWLVSPKFNGATYLYAKFMRKYAKVMVIRSSTTYPDGQGKEYIAKDASERVIKAVEMEAKKQ